MERNFTQEELNGVISTNLIPSTAILVLYLVLGLCGNFVVIVVYKCQMKDTTEERYFIPILALFDLVASAYGASYGIWKNLNYVMFENNILCKLLQYCTGVSAYISIMLLLIIAIQRYVKICVPSKSSMSLSFRRSVLSAAGLISLIFAVPIILIYDVDLFKRNHNEPFGKRCELQKNGLPYAITVGFVSIAFAVAMTILYTRIGYVVYKKLKGKSNNEKIHMVKTNEHVHELSTDSKDEPEIEIQEVHATRIPKTDKNCSTNRCSITNTELTPSNDRLVKRKARITIKLTLIFLVITVLFLFCYLPTVVMLHLEAIYPGLLRQLSGQQQLSVTIIHQLYIVNHVVNPFVYAFMDNKFRSETRNMLNSKIAYLRSSCFN